MTESSNKAPTLAAMAKLRAEARQVLDTFVGGEDAPLIARLAEANLTLLDALSQAEGVIEPFKRVADTYLDTCEDAYFIRDDDGLTLGELRAAATFLASLKEKK